MAGVIRQAFVASQAKLPRAGVMGCTAAEAYQGNARQQLPKPPLASEVDQCCVDRPHTRFKGTNQAAGCMSVASHAQKQKQGPMMSLLCASCCQESGALLLIQARLSLKSPEESKRNLALQCFAIFVRSSPS